MAATDDYAYFAIPLSGPAVGGAAVTPDNDNDLTRVTRGLWVGGAGAVAVTTADGTALTLSGVAAGSLLPIRVSRVKSTGTTATLIVALW